MTVGPDHNKRYGKPHRRLRAEWRSKVERGEVHCARCGRWIAPHEEWDLGHADNDPTRYAGPEHAACNRATKAHAKARRSTRATRSSGITYSEPFAAEPAWDDETVTCQWHPSGCVKEHGSVHPQWSRDWFEML
jgi:hypothetical protein